MALEELRRRAAERKKTGVSAPVRSIMENLFPRMSSDVREGLIGVLQQAGINKGIDFRRKSFGDLCDELNVPERVCKVLLDRKLVKQGAPKEVMWYGVESYRSEPLSTVPEELDELAGRCDLGRVRPYATAVKGKTWLQVATEHMSAEEQTDALCDPDQAQIIYGFRAMLRIISRVLPVKLSLDESDSFIGTLYLSTSDVANDWSNCVWILQAMPPEMHYLEAMGRLVKGISLMFSHQLSRQFAIGIVGMADTLDVYTFWREDQKVVEGKLVPVPRTITHNMLTLQRTNCGVEALMLLMCTPLCFLGFRQVT